MLCTRRACTDLLHARPPGQLPLGLDVGAAPNEIRGCRLCAGRCADGDARTALYALYALCALCALYALYALYALCALYAVT